nr:hypothetical protein [uncultured Halomonas sp.]
MKYLPCFLVSALTSAVVTVAVIVMSNEYLDKDLSSAEVANSMSEQEILNLQIASVSGEIKHIFASQPSYSNENLVPFLSGGSDRLEYTGFLPYVSPQNEEQLIKNAKHILAISRLTFANEGQELFSTIAGRVMVQGRGDEFIIGLPDCPQKLCLDRQYTFK